MQNGAVSYGRDIYESLAEYITDERYHQAVLLNGSWGSGKTWFIKEEFIPAFEQNHEEDGWCFVYLSLYGLKTVQQLEDKIRQAVMQRLLARYFARTGATPKETEKFLGIAKNAAGVVSSVVAFASKMFLPIQGLPDVKWCNLQKVLPKPERMVYIIDDLERAGMEAEEVLGYINEMTEHEAAKVIILANEEEIYRINDFTKSLQKKKQNADPKETAGNARRERYERIKEKTIGLDIAYQVSVADIYDSLIERYVKSGSLKTYLQAQKEHVVGVFSEKARGNLRTLIFAFIACDKFYPLVEGAYDVWKEEHCQEGEVVLRSIFSDLASDVIRYTVHASIAWKQREEFQTPSTEFGKIPVLWRVYFPYNYPFVDGFIQKRRLEESEVGKVITDVLEDLLDTSQGRNEAYKKLMNWQLLTDEEIEKYLERLKEEIPKKKLNSDYIRNLFLTLIYISRVGIHVSMQDYVNAILSKLRDGTLSSFFIANILYVVPSIDDDVMKEKYNTILKPIYVFLKNASQEWRSNQSQFLINNEWTPAFKMKCMEQEEHFIEDKKFLAYADPQMVLEKLKTASPAEISYFRSGIAYVYRISNAGDFYQADLPVITAIADGIAVEADTGSKVKNWHLGRLKEFLVSCRGRLEE